MNLGRQIDHIVYAVKDLEVAIEWFEAQTGIRPVFGGYHQTQGTKNALVNLGDACYLEILAIDPNNLAIQAPRWMGIDLIETACITRWALKSSDLLSDAAILERHNKALGNRQTGQRKTTDGTMLSWEMTIPSAAPQIELLPFMVDWRSSSAHPTQNLKPACVLKNISFHHPNPNTLKAAFDQLQINTIILEADTPQVKIHIDSPNGIVLL